ncbi:hypothetical protein F0562_024419 [Nyssa sinensis]|uniref:Auxin-responsive protein n=1 Tax=Nyssa sinensis TaxID=561372 RepID=A0A5J5BFQ6_9ASTE|nr:hypothetical protein F0562_024419 [Nyssa sinensis]
MIKSSCQVDSEYEQCNKAMDEGEGKKKSTFKLWVRCLSVLGGHGKSSAMPSNRSESWHCTKKTSKGCFSVYVGPEKQRFMVKIQYVNHPLFKMLLEDAALEYGYNSEGPILLPCDVNLFYKVFAEIESKETRPGWGFAYGSCSPFNPSGRLGCSDMAKGYGSYLLLTPAP